MLTWSRASTLLLIGASIMVTQWKEAKSQTTPEQVTEMTTILIEEITTPHVETVMSTKNPIPDKAKSQTIPEQVAEITTILAKYITTPQVETIMSTKNPIPDNTEPSTSTDKSTNTEPDTPKDDNDEPVTTESVPVYDTSFLRWFNGTEWSSQECKDAVLARYGEPDLEDLNCGSVNMFLQFSDDYNCDRDEKCQMLRHFCNNSADRKKEFIKANIKALCK